MASDTDRIAQVWPGWRTEELIGRGGFGSVYRASRTVANYTSTAAVKIIDVPSEASNIKELRSMGMDDASIRDYFGQSARSLMSEIAAMDSLKGSANIVQIEDYQLREQEDGLGWTVFIRMELLESLETYQERVGLPDQWEAARIGSQICSALARCHAIGIIHRDVKPANIFRNKFGDYKLGDFGIAKNLDNATRSTMSFAGTRPFMAPEVESGHYDGSVDTYSLGIMLYRWLNGGRPPFVGPDEVPTQAALARAQARRLAGDRPPLPAGEGVDPGLAAMVLRACEPDPADRWASAEEFGRALQSWLAGHPAPAAPADGPSAGAETPPGAGALSTPPQDSAALTVDFKDWLGEGGKPKPEPTSPTASHSATNAWLNARDNLQDRSSIPRAASGKAGASKPKPNMTVPTASSASPKASESKPASTAALLAKEDALRKILIVSIIVGVLYGAFSIYYDIVIRQYNIGTLLFLARGLYSGSRIFAFSVWALLALESADSMWQKVLTIITAGFLAFIICGFFFSFTEYFAVDFIVGLIHVTGPVGSLIHNKAKTLKKTVPTASSASPKASAAKPASTAALLGEEDALRKILIVSIIVGVLYGAFSIYCDITERQYFQGLLWHLVRGLYCGSLIAFAFSVWALLALESADSMWQKVLTIITAGFLAFLSSGVLYQVTEITVVDFVFYLIAYAGPVGSLINYMANMLKKK